MTPPVPVHCLLLNWLLPPPCSRTETGSSGAAVSRCVVQWPRRYLFLVISHQESKQKHSRAAHRLAAPGTNTSQALLHVNCTHTHTHPTDHRPLSFFKSYIPSLTMKMFQKLSQPELSTFALPPLSVKYLPLLQSTHILS